MVKLIFSFFVVSLVCVTLAQDFEPPLLEGAKTTTLETPTAATKTPAETTDAPSTETPSTETPRTTTTTTTEIVATEPVTDSPFPTTQKTTTTTTTTPRTTTLNTTRKPDSWYPNLPNYNTNTCYYKSQQGFPQMRWKCGRLEFVTPTECFHCCLYSNSYFAGCYRVHDSFCKTNNIHNDNDFSYFK